MLAGNIDRNKGAGRFEAVEQNPNLDARTGAEFHDGGTTADHVSHLRDMGMQNTQLGAGRVILGQPGDPVEKL